MCEYCSMNHSSSQEYGPPTTCSCGAPPPGTKTGPVTLKELFLLGVEIILIPIMLVVTIIIVIVFPGSRG